MDSEQSPLVAKDRNSYTSGDVEHYPEHLEVQQQNDEASHKAPVFTTSLHMVKLSIGTGVLAIPFAASQGGLLFHILGLFVMTVWNIYSVHCLAESRMYVEGQKASFQDSADNIHRHKEPKNTNTFGMITWYALGSKGLHALDFILTLLMFGIMIAYEDAILNFAEDTPFTTGSKMIDALVLLIVIIPVLMLPNYESIARVSALGNSLILIVFVVIGVYGLQEYGTEGFNLTSKKDLWPESFSAFSSWFGVCAFGYGVVPFTFDIQESMAEPKQLMKAANISMFSVFIVYVILGDIISLLFVHGIRGDIISQLPSGMIPTVIRILMIITVLSSVPLLIIPAGNLVYNKIVGKPKNASQEMGVFIVRFIFAQLSALCSVAMPNFTFVISFIGCLCVTLTSYVIPSLLHAVCIYKFCPKERRRSKLKVIVLDTIIVILGIVATVITSVLAFRKMMDEIN